MVASASSSVRPAERPHVALVGFMGAGKSEVGRLVAARTGLHFAGHAEYAGMTQAVGGLEIVEGLVEDEERLVGDLGHARLESGIELVEATLERRQIVLVAGGVGRVGGSQVGGHASGDQPGVGRQQPEMGVHRAGTMVVVVLVFVVLVQDRWPDWGFGRAAVSAAAVALLAAYALFAVRFPGRGPHDRIVGTYVVPA